MMNRVLAAFHAVLSAFGRNRVHRRLNSVEVFKFSDGLSDQFAIEERVKMEVSNALLKAEVPRYILQRKVAAVFKEEVEYFRRIVVEPLCVWMEVLNLLAQVFVLRAKARVLSFKQSRLAARQRALLFENRKLLFQKSEMLSHNSSRAVLLNELVNQSKGVK